MDFNKSYTPKLLNERMARHAKYMRTVLMRSQEALSPEPRTITGRWKLLDHPIDISDKLRERKEPEYSI
ncbi:hypothetical protein J4217_04235 [Candidatus Pacearchaeota archaeon]|nr:hypothetical protein [Candidatus Pacearchaeota archaeon]